MIMIQDKLFFISIHYLELPSLLTQMRIPLNTFEMKSTIQYPKNMNAVMMATLSLSFALFL